MHPFKKLSQSLFVTTMMLFGFTAVAFGSEHAHGGAHSAGGIATLIPFWVNFLLYIGLLYFLLRKQVSLTWAQRRQRISDAVQKAETELKEAEEKLRLARANFDNLEKEASKVRALIDNDAVVECDAIMAEAQKKAELAVQRAKDTAAAERSAKEKALRREIAEHVILLARQRLLEKTSYENDYGRRSSALGAFKQMLQ